MKRIFTAVGAMTLASLCSSLAPAATLGLDDLNPGDLQITEYLANPVGIADQEGEYFEVFNRRSEPVNLSGLTVSDEGSNSFTVDGLILGARAFAIFSNGDGSALAFSPDYQYGGSMSLTNTDDEILLIGSANQVLQSLKYSDGDAFGAGVAHELILGDSSKSELLGPNLGGDYRFATDSLNLDNFGSPGRGGNTQFDSPVVPLPAAAWLFGSALISLLRLRRNEQKLR